MAATVNAVSAAAPGHPCWPIPRPTGQQTQLLAAAVTDVQARYATWTLGNLIAAIDRQLPNPDLAAAQRPALVEELARQVLEPNNTYVVLNAGTGGPGPGTEGLAARG
jgi:hypothetical protein